MPTASERSDGAAIPGHIFAKEILRPFLDHFLKDGAPPMDVAPVNAFESGTNTWRRLQSWPAGCTSGCNIKPTPLYLNAGMKAAMTAPAAGEAYDEYVSDPAKPVPFRASSESSDRIHRGVELVAVAGGRPT